MNQEELTQLSAAERRDLHDLVVLGVNDFESQVRNDPRMMGYIADSTLSLDEYRAMHSAIVTKLDSDSTVDCRPFDGDETMFMVALAEEGINVPPPPDSTPQDEADRQRHFESLITKARAMNEDFSTIERHARATSSPTVPEAPLSEQKYNRATLDAAGQRLDANDWDAHRKLAQIAVESGYAAEVTQVFNNDTSAEVPLEHSIRILDPSEVQPLPVDSAGMSTDWDAMGGTKEVEQFTPDSPHGDYGRKTPFDIAPINDDEPGFPQPSDAHLSALNVAPPPPPAPSSPSLG